MITSSPSVCGKYRAKMSRFGLVAALLCLSVAAHAEVYLVTLDTSGLSQSDSYGIDLQLSQGDPSNPLSAITVSNVLFTGGGSLDTNPNDLYTLGGVSGSLDATNGVTLSNTAFSNELTQNFSQTFAPGSSVSFDVNASGLSAPTGAAPDEFTTGLYDNTAEAFVATTDALGDSSPNGIELFTITPSAQGNATQTYGYTDTNGAFHGTDAALVGGASAAPEPASWKMCLIICLGLAGMSLRAHKRRAGGGA